MHLLAVHGRPQHLTTCFSSEDDWRGPCASTDRDRRLRLLQALVRLAPYHLRVYVHDLVMARCARMSPFDLRRLHLLRLSDAAAIAIRLQDPLMHRLPEVAHLIVVSAIRVDS